MLQPRWQDLFKLFPTLVLRVPLSTFFQLCPVIKPRYYRCVQVAIMWLRR